METPVRSHHHLTLCVGGAQEDYDFHVKTLGLRNVKKTLLYDGKVPIYHLYYGNEVGAESTLITCFPMRQDGRVGRFGSGQVKTVSLSVCAPGLEYRKQRLDRRGIRIGWWSCSAPGGSHFIIRAESNTSWSKSAMTYVTRGRAPIFLRDRRAGSLWGQSRSPRRSRDARLHDRRHGI